MRESELLKQHVLTLSVSQDYAEAIKEWAFIGFEYNGDYARCPCGQHIMQVCQIKNGMNGNLTTVGRVCVEKFMGMETGNLFIGLRRIQKDIYANPNLDLLRFSLKFDYINQDDHDYMTDLIASRWGMKDKRKIEINERILARVLTGAAYTAEIRRQEQQALEEARMAKELEQRAIEADLEEKRLQSQDIPDETPHEAEKRRRNDIKTVVLRRQYKYLFHQGMWASDDGKDIRDMPNYYSEECKKMWTWGYHSDRRSKQIYETTPAQFFTWCAQLLKLIADGEKPNWETGCVKKLDLLWKILIEEARTPIDDWGLIESRILSFSETRLRYW